MDTKQLLGKRIQELRRSSGYTQEEIAEIVNVAPRHISRIENGVNVPSIETLEKLAASFGVEIKEFYNFQHLKDEQKLRQDINLLLSKLDYKQISITHKLLSALFK